jgi:hypothetical protein
MMGVGGMWYGSFQRGVALAHPLQAKKNVKKSLNVGGGKGSTAGLDDYIYDDAGNGDDFGECKSLVRHWTAQVAIVKWSGISALLMLPCLAECMIMRCFV